MVEFRLHTPFERSLPLLKLVEPGLQPIEAIIVLLAAELGCLEGWRPGLWWGLGHGLVPLALCLALPWPLA